MIEWRKEFGIDINVDSLPINTLDQYTGQGYSEPDPEVFETVKMVVEQEAILLDPVYTGRAFHGMLEAIKKGKFTDANDIVFIHTGGAFGLLAQRNNFILDKSLMSIIQ
jgi:D-cysteine desulfhydrase